MHVGMHACTYSARMSGWVSAPPDLTLAHQADRAQHERAHATRVCLRVGERERGAPAAAKDDLPHLDAQQYPVGAQRRRRVCAGVQRRGGQGCRGAAAQTAAPRCRQSTAASRSLRGSPWAPSGRSHAGRTEPLGSGRGRRSRRAAGSSRHRGRRARIGPERLHPCRAPRSRACGRRRPRRACPCAAPV